MLLSLLHIEDLAGAFAEALSPDWIPLANGRERFGSWEWTASRWPDRRRPRAWVVMAVTPVEVEDRRATRVLTDAWAAAEIRQRFTRVPVTSTTLELNPDARAETLASVQMQVRMAATQAAQLRPGDIASTYEPLELVEPPPSGSAEPVPTDPRLVGPEELPIPVAWSQILAERGELSMTEAEAALGRPASRVLELALVEVRAGRLRLEQRGREIFLISGRARLSP